MFPPSIPAKSEAGYQRGLLGLLAALALVLPACEGGGQFTFLGYTSRPNYDPNIRTVFVPIFKNQTLYKHLEDELTRAVVREIEAKTPYKVVSSGTCADTVLEGKIISVNKLLINRTVFNEVREAGTYLAVELVWRDLRTGEILSLPRPPGAAALPPLAQTPPAAETSGGPLVLPPDAPGPVSPPPEHPTPVLVQADGNFIPELGGSFTTAQKQMTDRLAIQIVSMMEKPW